MKKLYLFLLFIPALFFYSCSKKKEGFRIGVDPNWYPVNLMGKESKVLLFSDELLQEIAVLEKLELNQVQENWDNLIQGLWEKKYEGALSSMKPYLFNKERYDFSEIYLKTGPVLVVRENSSFHSLEEASGKEISIPPNSSIALILDKYPNIIPRDYSNFSEGLEAVHTGQVDGALLPIIPALAFIKDNYAGKLKIATPPLSDDGLRLVTLHGKNQILITRFNEGLSKCRSSGVYKKLAEKWNLLEPSF